jgi:hypothetical protein
MRGKVKKATKAELNKYLGDVIALTQQHQWLHYAIFETTQGWVNVSYYMDSREYVVEVDNKWGKSFKTKAKAVDFLFGYNAMFIGFDKV